VIDFTGLPVVVEPMRVEDIGQVLEIEHASFTAPWSARAYEYELRYNNLAHYFVARPQMHAEATPRNGWPRRPREWLGGLFRPGGAPSPQWPSVVGYVGFWLMAGEAHISTIAVKPEFRGRSIGELMLVTAIDRAIELDAHMVTLEVRVSNTLAQELYLKYGFEKVGLRKSYYTDNNEDAIIMTTPAVRSPEYQQNFRRLKEALLLRLRENRTPARRHAQSTHKA
jgi:ribosomal-protein-alanine N-acetyltransferase